MVHPLDEPVDHKPVNPFDVPSEYPLSEESQMVDCLLYLTKDGENG
jgi:hypothetical protein